ncbi:MAG: transposase [bacterium]
MRYITRNFEVFDPLDFLAQVTQHIPDKGQHLTRYYGWYSNVARGKRAKTAGEQGSKTTHVRPATEAHKRWAMLIKQVYEVDPLVCDQPEGRKCPGLHGGSRKDPRMWREDEDSILHL